MNGFERKKIGEENGSIMVHFPLKYLVNRVIKRLYDITVSLLFLLLVAVWLFPIIALLIIIDDEGSVFFRQKRNGKNDEVFICYKFRSMVSHTEEGFISNPGNEEKITDLGRFLRKTNLDETPQFLNVLLGKMSIVGPRPHMLSVNDFYRNEIENYSLRNKVKPGITGWAQINGLRGGYQKKEMIERVQADIYYIRKWSFYLDIMITVKTIKLLLFGDKNITL